MASERLRTTNERLDDRLVRPDGSGPMAAVPGGGGGIDEYFFIATITSPSQNQSFPSGSTPSISVYFNSDFFLGSGTSYVARVSVVNTCDASETVIDQLIIDTYGDHRVQQTLSGSFTPNGNCEDYQAFATQAITNGVGYNYYQEKWNDFSVDFTINQTLLINGPTHTTSYENNTWTSSLTGTGWTFAWNGAPAPTCDDDTDMTYSYSETSSSLTTSFTGPGTYCLQLVAIKPDNSTLTAYKLVTNSFGY